MKPMMKCGHRANATDGTGKDVCVICAGIVEGYNVADDSPPSLEGRQAKCPYRSCSSVRPSTDNLAFFKHNPEKDYDEFYCGCHGWD